MKDDHGTYKVTIKFKEPGDNEILITEEKSSVFPNRTQGV